ncbi:MAG: putative lipoprotein YbaY [Candidatus Erwinia impunctatus]|nr:putative lipoprotein YbaY [Culicoides impunctatus]
MKVLPLLASIFAVTLLSGCVNHKNSPAKTTIPQAENAATEEPAVKGVIVLGHRAVLPADAALTVRLSDISRADAPASILSQIVVLTCGTQPPFSFSLPFDATDIAPHGNVTLSATVSVGGKVTFINDEVIPVITNGVLDGDIVLKAVPSMLSPSGTTQ